MQSNKPPLIFDRKAIARCRSKASSKIDNYNFLHTRLAKELYTRILPINTQLDDVLVFGAHSHKLYKLLLNNIRVHNLYISDISKSLLSNNKIKLPDNCYPVVADEEILPFAKNSLDAIISNLTYHSVNDLKGALIQAHYALKAERPIIFAIFGGDNLRNIRNLLLNIETNIIGGAFSRIAPFIDIKTLGNLLQNCGFNQVVVDSEIIDITYNNLHDAIRDLRGMGEAGIMLRNNPPIRKEVYKQIKEQFIINEKGKVKIELLYAIAWS